jgi:hypothetical protein
MGGCVLHAPPRRIDRNKGQHERGLDQAADSEVYPYCDQYPGLPLRRELELQTRLPH